MSFCILEKDAKTFELLKSYIKSLDNPDTSCIQVDNQIQANEIKAHLKREGLTEKDSQSILVWIQDNSENFRQYLNSIKIAYLVCRCMNIEWDHISWEEFCTIEERINSLKGRVLDTIF
ncbi:hypothetical protein [Spirochaeta cellobiosiphila]|uniref:hypothetical protein n=1 Tax=Spirochaeta cellobiosiphila TaxID=504483 RepID=UPI0004234205|nr:hypothetical protein [Spirochaeta cellobiosiphila]